MAKDKKTNIQIMVSTREKLSEIGKHSETYDDIINRLIDNANKRD